MSIIASGAWFVNRISLGDSKLALNHAHIKWERGT